jgi:hypothetical protein
MAWQPGDHRFGALVGQCRLMACVPAVSVWQATTMAHEGFACSSFTTSFNAVSESARMVDFPVSKLMP